MCESLMLFIGNIVFAKSKACSFVNMDTSHLYAACKLLDISCEHYAIVSNF